MLESVLGQNMRDAQTKDSVTRAAVAEAGGSGGGPTCMQRLGWSPYGHSAWYQGVITSNTHPTRSVSRSLVPCLAPGFQHASKGREALSRRGCEAAGRGFCICFPALSTRQLADTLVRQTKPRTSWLTCSHPQSSHCRVNDLAGLSQQQALHTLHYRTATKTHRAQRTNPPSHHHTTPPALTAARGCARRTRGACPARSRTRAARSS
jgi:hypothetical protein